MRGLDGDEVYAFLSTIADEYEALLNENKALRERLLELDDKVQEYRNMEKTLRDTLITAERVTVDAKDNAKREANLIIKQAELEAEKGIRNIAASAMKLRQEIVSLKRQRDGYLARLKSLVESHLKVLQSAERDFDDDDRVANSIARAVEPPAASPPPANVRDTRVPRSPATFTPDDAGGSSQSPTREQRAPAPRFKPGPDTPEDTLDSRALAGDQATATAVQTEIIALVMADERLVDDIAGEVADDVERFAENEVDDASTESVEMSGPIFPTAERTADGDGSTNTTDAKWSIERLKQAMLADRRPNDDKG